MANYENNGSGPLARASAKGTVKWFNATKGYGFVTLDDGADAFCHASALAALGAPSLLQGSTIVCDLQDSPRGLQVVTVHSVDASTAEAPPARKPRRDFGDGGGYGGGDRFGGGRGGDRFGGGHDRFGGGNDRFGGGDRFGSSDRFSSGGGYRERDAGPSGPMVEGKVKFFNDQKGFGFVMPDGGGGDIYMHASALRRSGLQMLEPEQRIRYSTRQGNKGVEVDRVEVI
jgi:CspA family cold shock protein